MNKKTFLTLSILVVVVVVGAIMFVLNDSGEEQSVEKENPPEENQTSDDKVSNESTPNGSIEEGITREKELEMESEIEEHNSSEEIMNFINSDFKLIEKDNKTNLTPVYELYKRKNGSEYEALRLARFMLQKNGIEAVYFVYKYGDGFDAVINFRDVDKPKYCYFEDSTLKMKHHGYSFEELILSEEERRDISIKEFGTLTTNALTKRDELNLLNVSVWEDRDEWVK